MREYHYDPNYGDHNPDVEEDYYGENEDDVDDYSGEEDFLIEELSSEETFHDEWQRDCVGSLNQSAEQ